MHTCSSSPVVSSLHSPTAKKQKTKHYLLFWCCVLFTTLFANSFLIAGCCHAKKELTDNATVPINEPLSPEAQQLYYYLLLTDSFLTNDTQVMVSALKGFVRLDPTAAIYQDAGTILLSHREFDAASSILQEAVLRYPTHVTLHTMLSAAYSETGNDQAAIDLLEKFIDASPKPDINIMQELTRLYLKTQNVEKAATLLKKIPSDRSSRTDFFKARVLSLAGDYTAAKEKLGQIRNREPRNPDLWIEFGLIAEKEKDLDAAVNYFKKATQFDPLRNEVWYRIIGLQLKNKQVNDAFETVLRANPDITFHFEAALLFAESGHTVEAEKILQRAQSLGADKDELAVYKSLLIFETTNDPKAALAPLESISEKSQAYEFALERRLRLYLMAKDYQSAISIANKARSKYPEKITFIELEAYALSKMGKFRAARNIIESSLKKDAKNVALLFALANTEEEAGNKSKAMEVMETILTHNPRNARALNYIGYTLAEDNKDLLRANQLILAALKEEPDADYIVDSLAWVQYRLGKFEEAWQTIQRCIRMGASEPTIWEHYGDIALAVNNTQEAIKGYSEALKLNPDNAQAIAKKLEKIQPK